MKKLLVLFFTGIALLFFACGKDSAPDPAPPVADPADIVPDLRVMTYNIHLANPPSAGTKRDLPAIARVINSAKPDLVVLQEVDRYTERSGLGIDQAEALGKLTSMHAFYVKAMDVSGGGAYGIAVLSRFPILDSAGYELPADPSIGGEMRKLAVIKVALPDGREVVFAGTHMDHKSEENRLYQGDRLRKILQRETLPVILAGDFNALPTSMTIDFMDRYFTRTCRHNCSPTFTASNPKSPIDFIMYRSTDEMEVVSHKIILESHASDHLPVVAELKIN